ncbi:hypothetical protein [Companilactobacillus zhongbaensis]|nr:hypothetical protein [Companilactobacillus zhongbaensis]
MTAKMRGTEQMSKPKIKTKRTRRDCERIEQASHKAKAREEKNYQLLSNK